MIHKVKVDRTGRNVKSRDTGDEEERPGLDLPDTADGEAPGEQEDPGVWKLSTKFQRRGEGWSRTLMPRTSTSKGKGRWLNT